MLLTLLYGLAPVAIAHLPIVDPDIWWHLREGQWIVEHGAVPYTDPFSAYGVGKRWFAYSWLFEVLVYGLFRVWGFVGLALYTVALSLAVTVALHRLVRTLHPSFPLSCILTALGILGMMPVLLHPRPWLLNIVLFIIVVTVLFSVRQSGNDRPLLLLPPLFVLWANINIQFVYGLFVIGLAASEPVIERLLRRPERAESFRFGRMTLTLLACIVATLMTPYHLLIYLPVFDAIRLTDPFLYLKELQPLAFRASFDWIVLALTLSAAFALGWRKESAPFPLLLLASGALFAFRARRDVWFVLVAAVAVLALSARRHAKPEEFVFTRPRVLALALALAGVLLVVSSWTLSNRRLEDALSKTFPVAAAAFVEERGYRGSLYNHYDWGGYLIWRLPDLAVSMDGRNPLHGDARILRSIATWDGKRGWASDPELVAAELVIASVDHALVSLLRLDTRFQLVYEDAVAAVFVARREN